MTSPTDFASAKTHVQQRKSRDAQYLFFLLKKVATISSQQGKIGVKC